MFSKFTSGSKKKSQYRPIDHDSDDDNPNLDEEREQANHTGSNISSESESSVNENLRPRNSIQDEIPNTTHGDNIYIPLISTHEINNVLETPSVSENINENPDTVPIIIVPPETIEMTEFPANSANEQNNSENSSSPTWAISPISRLSTWFQGTFFYSRHRENNENIQLAPEPTPESSTPNPEDSNSASNQVIQVSVVDQIDEVNDDDDPFCHQALLVFGICCNYPFLWFIGALLWCITPKNHLRSRRWGLSNLVMSALFFSYLFSQNKLAPDLLTPDITLFSRSEHHPNGETSLMDSGQIIYNTYTNVINHLNTPKESWKGLVFNLNPKDNRYGSFEILEKFPWLDNDCSDIKWDPILNGVLGPEITVSGRILFQTTFTSEMNKHSDSKQLATSKNCIDYQDPRNIVSENPFPSNFPFSLCTITDKEVPTTFTGSGLRCTKDEEYKWFLLCPLSHLDFENFYYTTSKTLYFDGTYSCNIALISTLSDSTLPYNIKEFSLRTLPSRAT